MKDKGSKLKYFVVFSITVIMLMTIAVLLLKAITHEDYSSEYTIFCGVFGGEVLSCALIKIFQIKRGE